MLWRKFKLDWKYASGELVIVTVGVLIALAIDQWNDRRLELITERLIIDQILRDLDVDIENVTYALEMLQSKETSLLRLQSALSDESDAVNGRQLMEDIVVGANFGWNQGRPLSTSFDEIKSSGKFSLIRNADLRRSIATYYLNWEDYESRADERETDFPNVSYLLAPRRFVGQTDLSQAASGQIGILELDPNLSSEEIEALVRSVRKSELPGLITGEVNFARFLREMMKDIRNDALKLKADLQAYRLSLGN